MASTKEDDPRTKTTTEEQIRAYTIGELKPLTAPILLSDYDPKWPLLFEREAGRIRTILGDRVKLLEHAGSTSVADLAAKPVIDMILAVPDSSDESTYVPEMEMAGYVLRIREPDWFEHRVFKGPDTDINLHVFTGGCAEIDQMLLFRDWLRVHRDDRDLYGAKKRELAKREWTFTQNYADAKTGIVHQILARARAADESTTRTSMPAARMDIDVPLVGRLISTQFPRWADLPIRPCEPGGWDNRTFHLGDQMTVRLPSAERYVEQVEKEHRWLPKLAPLLPLPIPVPLALGAPDRDYPWPWSVYRWLNGETASPERVTDLPRFAFELAQFLIALQRIDVTGGPPPGAHNFSRGGPLATYDRETRQAIEILESELDTATVTAVWEAALATTWSRAPVWVHGDVAAGNLLVEKGRLSAVIDFGCCGVGDPACDLAIAWGLLGGDSREAFRAALPLDRATWARGRGWALWKALITWVAHPDHLPEALRVRGIVDEVLADHRLQS